MIVRKETTLGDTKISFESGVFAPKAHCSILATMGETVVLATVVTREMKENPGFFPLTIEYMERLYASGMISSSRFIKREGRPSSNEILKARMIDRSIRPIFKEDFRDEIQLVVTVLSYDKLNDPVIIGISAASLALMVAGIPFEGPVAGLRVGLLNNEFILNPIPTILDSSDLNLFISSTKDSISMIEAGANNIPENKMIEAIEFAKNQTKPLIDIQNDFLNEINNDNKIEYIKHGVDESLLKEIDSKFHDDIEKSIWDTENKELEKKIGETFDTDHDPKDVEEAVHELFRRSFRGGILKNSIRPDKRALDEVRPLYIKIDILPRTHGSAIFQRGETQILSVATLASAKQSQTIENIEGEEVKRYMHHYNFPGWSVGEISRNLYYPSRRDIGHGALAERALERQIPPMSEFPYAIRVVSETLSSNGSSSMASVCGSTLALMAAGVKIKNPISGIAMGLVMDESTKKYVILTDIQGPEDHFGDMDFKVAGSKDGITALQMDNKLKGISIEVLKEALEQAKKARLFILSKMLEVLPTPRESLSIYAPQIKIIKIDPTKIGEVIGGGGKTIKNIIEKSGTDIEISDDGSISISAVEEKQFALALKMIENITKEVEIGHTYEGTVAKITTYGAFINVTPSISGLVHVSEMSDTFTKDPTDIVSEGDTVLIKIIGKDDQGRLKFSMKQASESDKE
ncbi:MAG: polyribonucleotide nucleotidyltransferase [Patescibacteria group bacterium]